MESLKLKNDKYWDASGVFDHQELKTQEEINANFKNEFNEVIDGIAGKQAKITESGILKGDGNGGITAAVAGADYLQSAPVTSVNGQTGDVTIQAATDDQVATAANAWLGENIAQETGYVIDASLTMNNAAPPASALGDLKSAINQITNIVNLFDVADIPSGNYNKRLTASGTLASGNGYYVSGYIPVVEGNKYQKNSPTEDAYHRLCVYDSAKAFIPNSATNENTITIPQGGAFVRFCGAQTELETASFGYLTAKDVEARTDIQLLQELTGGEYKRILPSSDNDLNNYTALGNYYCATTADATALLNCPVSIAFDMAIYNSIPGGTNYVTQELKPYDPRKNSVKFVRRHTISSGTWSEWKAFATTDLATDSADGLMSASDKAILDTLHDERSTVKTNGSLFPAIISTASDLLELEKTRAIYHDNFARADNASDIGVNGASTSFAAYTTMPNNGALQIGISGQKAVATNPGGAASGYKQFKVRNAERLPYKILVTFVTNGGVVISPVDTNNYIYVYATANSFAVGGIGTLALSETEVIHNAGVTSLEVYVDTNLLEVYVAGQKLYTGAIQPVNTLCGLYFSADELSIAYTNFAILVFEQNLLCNIDDVIENCATPKQELIGTIQTADASYGVTFDSSVTRHSLKSIRFEQRKADTSQIYRSEIVPKNPRIHNGYQVNWQLQSKIIEFDIYLPQDYVIDTKQEILMQMHNTPDNVNADGLWPNIALQTINGHWGFYIRSAEQKISTAEESTVNYYDLGEYEAGKWTHFLIYLHDGYLPEHHPCTAIWMDGELALYERIPNTYNTTRGSYLKMGMYKTSYTSPTDTGSTVRVVNVDNIRIWM